jgi:hypothetical protein
MLGDIVIKIGSGVAKAFSKETKIIREIKHRKSRFSFM